jgi:hypothetical protein
VLSRRDEATVGICHRGVRYGGSCQPTRLLVPRAKRPVDSLHMNHETHLPRADRSSNRNATDHNHHRTSRQMHEWVAQAERRVQRVAAQVHKLAELLAREKPRFFAVALVVARLCRRRVSSAARHTLLPPGRATEQRGGLSQSRAGFHCAERRAFTAQRGGLSQSRAAGFHRAERRAFTGFRRRRTARRCAAQPRRAVRPGMVVRRRRIALGQ